MSRGARARLFVAADLPAPVREELISWTRGAAGGLQAAGGGPQLRLLGADVLHLTLCFLGSRPVEEIAVIGSTLGACAGHMGELSLGAPVWLGGGRPRSLAVEIHDEDGELASLQAAVSEAVSVATGWEPERRRFRAHVTVARTRGRPTIGAPARGRGVRASGEAGDRLPLPATPPLLFTAESVTLYRSWLSPMGAAYEPLCRCTLLPSEV